MKKPSKSNTPPYLNPGLSFDERVEDLVSRMTLPEKIAQTLYTAPAIPRLAIQEYNWWNECLHGVARAGIATVFPQAIGMAASFDPDLLYQVAKVISAEARAKHHEFDRLGDRGNSKGLTFWSPNVNIFRDPRWGRGQETYGEDPYLTSRMGVAFVKGLQGNDPKYLKVVATPKHFAVHSGPDGLRHHFDAVIGEKDLRETYLFAFKACVVEGKAYSVMGAYNRVNGEPCCASRTLLQKILREEWGFEGYVVSDCGAILDIHLHHMVTSTAEQSAALAVNNGCDLNCGNTYNSLTQAVELGLISEETIDRSVKRLFKARFLLGMFDPPEQVPYARLPYSVNDAPAHRELASRMARESMVLLKNQDGLLPLSRKLKSIAVIGPNADDRKVLLGNYSGSPSSYVTLLDGIRAKVCADTEVIYAKGCDWLYRPIDSWGYGGRQDMTEALAAAERAEVAVLCLGITADIEREEGSAEASEWAGDRLRIDLPPIQQELLEKVWGIGKPVVLVLLGGSAVAVNWAQRNVPSILMAWYPGEEGGTAVADVLFGDYNPAGRLPITFVESLDQLPPYTDYRMRGRTYRYLASEPLYPFGYGLSYSTFIYGGLSLNANSLTAGQELLVKITVTNSGSLAGEEVVQLYLSDVEASVTVPRWRLEGFQRIHLQPRETKVLSFTITPRKMALIDESGRCILEPGMFRVYVGGSQPDPRSRALTGRAVLSAMFEVTGQSMELPY